MAIAVSNNGESRGTFRIVVYAVVVLGLLIATYVLFFTSPPKIEVFSPPEVQQISKISDVKVDPEAILNSPEYKSLEQYVDKPEFGDFGRSNPFARF